MKIPREKLALHHGGKKRWKAGHSDIWTSLEQAALNHYEKTGWRGCAVEGGLILQLIKAASFPNLPVSHRSTFVEALYYLSSEPEVRILLQNIRKSNVRRIRRTMESMLGGTVSSWPFLARASDLKFEYFPHLKAWHLLEAYKTLGASRLAEIAEVFARDPYTYRSGWPDLSVWKNDDIAFKEIKGPNDTLRDSQRKTIGDILIPLGFPVAIVEVRAI